MRNTIEDSSSAIVKHRWYWNEFVCAALYMILSLDLYTLIPYSTPKINIAVNNIKPLKKIILAIMVFRQKLLPGNAIFVTKCWWFNNLLHYAHI